MVIFRHCRFNFRNIDLSNGEGNSQLEKNFIDTLNEMFLVQMIDKPTTGRGNNIIDLLCISDPSCIDKLEVEESFAMIDHKSIKLLLRCPVTSQSKFFYLFSKANYEAIKKQT